MGTVERLRAAAKTPEREAPADDVWIKRQAAQILVQLPENKANALAILRQAMMMVKWQHRPLKRGVRALPPGRA